MRMSERQQKFYAISIWCLVPVLGIIVAIILIFYAIFNLRSKVFLAVILIEIVLNISITYYMEHEMDRKVFYSPPELVSYDLDNVVAKLELYKTRKGDFPDNLQQLQKEFPNVNIGDTLLRSTISRVKFGYYYYQRKGDKFLLFSTGWDRIPFNDDDIYPHDPLKRDPNILFAK
jgi:predicted nucleic-acid-binding protein